jgi:His-Xaa-Ser system protein HxsD
MARSKKPARPAKGGKKAAPRKQAAPRAQAAPRKTQTTPDGDVLAGIGLGSVTLSLDSAVYPLSVVHGAAYVFLARAYVRLDRVKGRTTVRLTGKAPLDAKQLEALAGEFANELTNQFVREDIAEKTTRLRESVVGRALLGALGTGDELQGLGDDAAWGGPESTPTAAEAGAPGPGDDPLGIAVDWEVRFGHPADKDRDKLHATDPGPAEGAKELAARGSK